MRGYEGLFIFPPEAAPEARKDQLEKLKELIQKFGGSLSHTEEWGKRPLGYAIRKFREGHMVVHHFQLDSLKTNELRKALELQEDLIKYTLVTKALDKKGPTKEREPSKAPRSFSAPRNPAPASSSE